MEILSEEEMAARLQFRRPLHEKPDDTESLWCIPFEWGGNAKGTRISISKAKEISAELRASVAEAEYRQLLREFKKEQERTKEIGKTYTEMSDRWFKAMGEVGALKRRLARRRKK